MNHTDDSNDTITIRKDQYFATKEDLCKLEVKLSDAISKGFSTQTRWLIGIIVAVCARYVIK